MAEQVDRLSVIRHYDADDARRDALVEAFKRHVHAAKLDADYDADIEYMDGALVAFVDEQLRGAVSLETVERVIAATVEPGTGRGERITAQIMRALRDCGGQ